MIVHTHIYIPNTTAVTFKIMDYRRIRQEAESVIRRLLP